MKPSSNLVMMHAGDLMMSCFFFFLFNLVNFCFLITLVEVDWKKPKKKEGNTG